MSSEVEIKKMEASLMYKEKNMVVAYLLWFFLGAFGGHRFYLGKTKSAVGMLVLFILGLLTAGILLIPFYIWFLADAYFVYKITSDHNDEMTLKKMEFLKAQEEASKEEKVKEVVVETVEESNEEK